VTGALSVDINASVSVHLKMAVGEDG
jgi:hypothetical protein